MSFLSTSAYRSIIHLIVSFIQKGGEGRLKKPRLYLNMHTGLALSFISNNYQPYCDFLKHIARKTHTVSLIHSMIYLCASAKQFIAFNVPLVPKV